MDVLASLSPALKIVLPTLAYTGGAVAGYIPKFGPGRALSFALYSRIRSALVKSDRQDVINRLQGSLEAMKMGGYVVVRGPKGVGKTCAIDTATERRWGVCRVKVRPGETAETIVDKTLREITRMDFSKQSPFYQARRVLFFYNLPSVFGVHTLPPTVVLQVDEVQPGEKYAGMVGTVRDLSESYGLRVVVDSSDNSLPPGSLGSIREEAVYVTLMPQAQIYNIFEELRDQLENLDLLEITWAVLGGNPAHWKRLTRRLMSSYDIKETTLDYLHEELVKSSKERSDAIVAMPEFEERIAEFTDKDIIKALKVKVPPFSKVLREVGDDLIPATPAMALFLRMGWEWAPQRETLDEELKEAIKELSPAPQRN